MPGHSVSAEVLTSWSLNSTTGVCLFIVVEICGIVHDLLRRRTAPPTQIRDIATVLDRTRHTSPSICAVPAIIFSHLRNFTTNYETQYPYCCSSDCTLRQFGRPLLLGAVGKSTRLGDPVPCARVIQEWFRIMLSAAASPCAESGAGGLPSLPTC